MLWLAHLSDIGTQATVGQPLTLQINGLGVTFVPMRPGKDGRLTKGWEASASDADTWNSIPKGATMHIEADDAGPAIAAVPPLAAACRRTPKKTDSALSAPGSPSDSPLQLAWSGLGHRPGLVVHSDWSMHSSKRRQASAALNKDGHYLATAPKPLPEPGQVIREFQRQAANSSVLAGFDFAIGLPRTYSANAGIRDFLTVLPQLGTGAWKDFFQVAGEPSEISLQRPFFPRTATTKGRVSHAHLCAGLGVRGVDELRRRCDLPGPSRNAAEVMFWTLGPRQVGKAVISGWRDMLQPARREIGDKLLLWPFDGLLETLLAPGRMVVVETYPAEIYRHFGIRVSKRQQSSRKRAGETLINWARRAGVRLSDQLLAQLRDGFGPLGDGEDDFDAVVGLFGMLNVILGYRTLEEPADPSSCRVEGWMFGCTPPGHRSK